ELLKRSLERVSVELVAAPNLVDTRHDIEVSGSAGTFSLVSESGPNPVNPKTSAITALSVAHTLRQALNSSQSSGSQKTIRRPFATFQLGYVARVRSVSECYLKESGYELQCLSFRGNPHRLA